MANRIKGQWKRKRRVESYPVSSIALAPTCYVHHTMFEYLLNDAKSHYSRYIFIVQLRMGAGWAIVLHNGICMRASIRVDTVKSQNWIWDEMNLRSRCRCDDNNDNDERNRNKQRTKRAADEKICWGAPHRLMDYPFERISCSQMKTMYSCIAHETSSWEVHSAQDVSLSSPQHTSLRFGTQRHICAAGLTCSMRILLFRARGRTNFAPMNNFQLRMQSIHFTRCGIRCSVCCVRTPNAITRNIPMTRKNSCNEKWSELIF